MVNCKWSVYCTVSANAYGRHTVQRNAPAAAIVPLMTHVLLQKVKPQTLQLPEGKKSNYK